MKTRTSTHLAQTGLVLALVLAGGCSHKPQAPTGQVVATVDGTEITDAMIESEARANNVPAQSLGAGQVRKALLEEVIARTLLAGQARKEKLDQTPEALADVERLKQDFTARLLLTKQISRPEPISDAAVQKYIAAHPEVFGDRTLLKVEQIRYWSAGDAVGSKYYEGAGILEEVQAQLGLTHKPFERRTVVLDPAVVGQALIDRLAATPENTLYHYDANGMTVVGSVLAKTTQRIPAEQAVGIARERMARADVNGQVTSLIERLKKQAKILYRKNS